MEKPQSGAPFTLRPQLLKPTMRKRRQTQTETQEGSDGALVYSKAAQYYIRSLEDRGEGKIEGEQDSEREHRRDDAPSGAETG